MSSTKFSNISTLTVSAIIGMILIVSVMVPITSGLSESAKATYNNPGDTGRALDLVGEHNITVDLTSRTITLDDEQIPFLTWHYLIVSDAFTVESWGTNMGYYGVSTSGTFDVMAGSNIVITLNGNAGTATNGTIENPYTFNANWIYIADPTSEDVNIIKPNVAEKVYLNNINDLKTTGWRTEQPAYYFSAIGKNVTWLDESCEAEYTTSDVKKGVISLEVGPDNWDYSVTYSGTTDNPKVLVAPHKVQDESNKLALSLVSYLPVILIASLVVMIAGAAIIAKKR